MNNLASALTGREGERIALCDVSVTAVLQDLLAEVTLSQTYRNDEQTNIEAVYTFPLPLDAVLLELEVEIGDRRLKGTVIEKRAAEEKYEHALEGGDSAVMLEAIEPGLYTMNVGNLLPQETAKITFRYAALYRWAGDRLRFFLPTTIAPRFGESPHRPHQVPETSLTVENQFSLRVDVSGALRDAQFVCPSHPVDLTRSADKVVLSLAQPKAAMDRDFILNVKASQAARSFILCGQDGEGIAAIASFQPFFPGLQQPRPLTLAIVVDCSGSMEGDSMAQAKQALDGILEGLQPQDRVTLIAFGNSTNVFSNHPLPCNKTNLAKAKRFAKSLDANMGGTEIGNALRETFSALGSAKPADIFLVTDGEVSDWEAVVEEAKKSGYRIFTVGVGSAVSEAFVRGLASNTGGECELVSPREGMADRVVRHFERMRAPRARRVAVRWPEGAHGVAPTKLGAVFEGDTVVACAQFDKTSVSGSVVLEVETEKGDITRLELPVETKALAQAGTSTVARLSASERLKEMEGGAGTETALRYQLVSPWTNWLVIAERPDDEKAQDIPALRKVPQTLAAGWGGVGTVAMCMSVNDLAMPSVLFSRSADVFEDIADSDASDLEAIRRVAGPDIPEPFRRLIALIEVRPDRLDARRILDLLDEAGLVREFDDVFAHTADLDINVEVIAMILLAHLLGGPLGEYLPEEARGAVVALQDRARQAMDAILELGRRSAALLGVTEDSVAREVLGPEQASDLTRSLKRVARFSDLLGHLQDSERRLVEQLNAKRSSLQGRSLISRA